MIYSVEGSEIDVPANDRCHFRLLVVLYQERWLMVRGGGGVCRCIPIALCLWAEMGNEK